jgi:hypothetical protein
MKLTIVPADTMVYVDNEGIYNLDLSYVPTNVHALQWKTNIGWIEYVDNDDGTKPGNQVVTERSFINEWLENSEKDSFDQIRNQIDDNTDATKTPPQRVECDNCHKENVLSIVLDHSTFFATA